MDATKITMEKVKPLLKEMEERRAWANTREFLRNRGLSGKEIKSWDRIQDAIEEIKKTEADWPTFVPHFHRFLQGVFLFGQKRVYLLSVKTINPSLLAADNPQPSDIGFFDDFMPDRPAEHIGYHFASWQIANIDVHTFITSRTAYVNEKISPNLLHDEHRSKFETSTLSVRTPRPVRCYDHFVIHNGQAYLIIDEPPYVENLSVNRDALRYEAQIRAQIAGQNPFIDLFPILKPIYNTSAEGIVNYVDFLSNDHATVRGGYRFNSNNDYRKHSFQQAGVSSGAQIDPFILGLKWPAITGRPAVLLWGEKEMAEAATAESGGTRRRSLDYMELPSHMDEVGFQHVVSRVLYHLGQVEMLRPPVTASPPPPDHLEASSGSL